MRWDDITLAILAGFGCVTLLLAQINDLLSKLPEVIRAWRRVRQELTDGDGTPGEPSGGADDAG
ncbi:hypothetical protein [Streptomyces hokutonensis]|uniref:Uncharacterized protein n=1 Tax=Streptomyces hokutonensis TaxID=1306990 RepID=A0ABW6MJK5_9ACTN